MASPLHDIGQGASPETKCSEHMMQVGQRGDRHPRLAHLHGRASGNVEHPRRDDCNDPWRYLNMDDLAVASLLAVLPPQSSSVQWVPSIADNDFIPDMGRMTS
jgi:hypothetical protein